MTAKDIKRRFRLVALGYVILALACAGGIYIDYRQTQDIKHQQSELRVLVHRLNH
jgi:hypothetical protein